MYVQYYYVYIYIYIYIYIRVPPRACSSLLNQGGLSQRDKIPVLLLLLVLCLL